GGRGPGPGGKAAEPPKPTPQADGSPATAMPQKGQAPPPHYHDRDDHVVATPPSSARPEDRAPQQPSVGAGLQARPSATATEEMIRERSSPLVRKIAKEHDVDISQIHGTGIAGRVTKDDILAFIGGGQPPPPPPPPKQVPSAGPRPPPPAFQPWPRAPVRKKS